MYADGAVAHVLAKDQKKDLLVLEVLDLDRPALRIAKANPKRGEEIISFGFGWGLERPMLRVSHIADDDTYIPEEGIGGPLMVTDAAFVAGMSGGPVINAAGEVVMMVQRGTGSVGLGVGAETIRSKIGRYLEKPKQP
jgi:S1-C subfamily serine protease